MNNGNKSIHAFDLQFKYILAFGFEWFFITLFFFLWMYFARNLDNNNIILCIPYITKTYTEDFCILFVFQNQVKILYCTYEQVSFFHFKDCNCKRKVISCNTIVIPTVNMVFITCHTKGIHCYLSVFYPLQPWSTNYSLEYNWKYSQFPLVLNLIYSRFISW